MYSNIFFALLLSGLAVGFHKLLVKQVAHRHFQRLLMAKAEGSKPKPKIQSALKISTVWARLSGELGNEVFSVKCDPSSTTIDDLKELVKLKCSSTLSGIDALKLVIKGADGSALRAGILLASRSDGKSDEDPFIVEFPKVGNVKPLNHNNI